MSPDMVVKKGQSIEIATEVAKAVAPDKGIIDQLGEVKKALDTIDGIMDNKLVAGAFKKWGEDFAKKHGIPLDQMPTEQRYAGVPPTQAPQTGLPQYAVVAPSEIHMKLMQSFAEIPEEKIHSFLKRYVGSEDIADVKAQIRKLLEAFG